MERAPDTPVTLEVATKVAQREGTKGIVSGSNRRWGSRTMPRAVFEASSCRLCGEQELGDAYALANQPDSAVAVYERYLDPVCSIVSIQTVLISGRFSSGLERSTRVVATWIGPSRYTPVSPIYGRTLTKCSSRVFVTRVHL